MQENFSKNLKKTITQSGFSIKKVSEMVGVTEQGMHNMFKNNDFKISTLEKIAEILDTTLIELLSEKNERSERKEEQSYLKVIEELTRTNGMLVNQNRELMAK